MLGRGGGALANPPCDPGDHSNSYDGQLQHQQTVLINLETTLCHSHAVSYIFTATKTSGVGANATIRFYSSADATGWLFQGNVIPTPSGSISLPVGHGLRIPYRVTLGAAGRPVKFEVISNTGEFEFQLTEQIFDRGPAEVNIGGLSMAEAREIQLGEVIQGNVHVKEGNQSNGGGQWYKFTIQPGQAVSTSGTILGGPVMGTSFGMVLWSGSGVQLATLGNQWAPDGEFEFPMEATFNYIYTYTHTGASPETLYLQVFASAGITHEFAFRVREVMMKFTILSQTIDPTNNYSEDTLVKVESVWGPDGEPLVEFSKNPIYIEETTPEKIYTQNASHGASLPEGFFLSRGTGEFLARSLAGPSGPSAPTSAKVRVKQFRGFGVDPAGLEIMQWWVPASKIDPLAGTDVPGWVQARVSDLRETYKTDYRASSAFQSLSSYSVYYEAGRDGTCDWDWVEKNPIKLNIYGDSKMRLDSDYPITACLISGKKIGRLTGTFLHESRHCYQMNRIRQSNCILESARGNC